MTTSHIGALVGLLIGSALITTSYAHLGSCEDHDSSCRSWASQGFCEKNLEFMALNCPVSCNLCLDPGCFDRSQFCPLWANQGICQTHRSRMQSTCPHSCNFCQIPLGDLQPVKRSRNLVASQFECGLPLGGGTSTGGRRRRQIIFPDELESFLQFKAAQRAGLLPAPPIANEPGAIPIEVTDAFCGATLIHERFLVTAAHCVLDPDNPVTSVRLGELDFSQENEANSKPADYEVERIIVHPDYNPNSVIRYNDFALIQTAQKVQFNDVVYPYCIPSIRPADNTLVIGSGFGVVNNTGGRSTILQEAEFNIVGSVECEDKYQKEEFGQVLEARYPQRLHGSDIICASFPGRDACTGDSGGPLFLEEEDGRRYLVGVVSTGISCRTNGVSSLPGFYVSVADHIEFINNVIFGQ